jgi:hypothetical protein
MENDPKAIGRTALQIRLRQTLEEAAQIYRRLGDTDHEQQLLQLALGLRQEARERMREMLKSDN